MRLDEFLAATRGRLIVSCQAPDGDPFRDPASMARFARAAELGGAAAIRANGPDDVRSIRAATGLPVIGIAKRLQDDGKVLITATWEDAVDLAAAGAAVIAVDCTARGQARGALERMRRIRAELRLPVMADIASLDEARAAIGAGAGLVASTMRGYTAETAAIHSLDLGFLAALCRESPVPVVAEGNVSTPEQARLAIEAGAHAVVVGTSITLPRELTRRFAAAMARAKTASSPLAAYVGVDLGGTNTKTGVVLADGRLLAPAVVPTPAAEGAGRLIEHVEGCVRAALERARKEGVEPCGVGVATAGWVDSGGRVVSSTGNLPGWTGTEVRRELELAIALPVSVENDANALALAERWLGLGRDVEDFVCVTLGTGVGGGCFIGGRLNRGAHSSANAIGHILVQPEGEPCTCGRRGCLEAYASASALMRYAGPAFASAEEVIRAAQSRDGRAAEAMRTFASWLATGLISVIQVLDPARVVLSGGLTVDNPLLPELTREQIACLAHPPPVAVSELGYFGGVLGAAAVHMERSG